MPFSLGRQYFQAFWMCSALVFQGVLGQFTCQNIIRSLDVMHSIGNFSNLCQLLSFDRISNLSNHLTFIGLPIVGSQHFQAFLDAQVYRFLGSQEAIYRQKPDQAFGGSCTQNRKIFKPSPTAQYRSDFKFFKTTDLHRPSPTWYLTFFSIFQHSGCTVHRFLRSQEAIYQPKPNQVVLGQIFW